MPETSPVRVAVAADGKYFPGLHCTVCSLLLHLDRTRPITLHVLDGGIDANAWRQLCRQGTQLHPRVTFERIALSSASFEGFSRHRTGSLLPYARLLLPSLLDADRVLYLDVDLFVGRDIGVLWDTDLAGCLAAVVPDAGVGVLANDWPWPVDPSVDLQAPYFNSGVLLMDLNGWRREDIEQRALQHSLAAPEKCRLWDQTVLNLLLRGRIRWVSDSWNRFFWQADRAGFEDMHCIIHYAAWTPWIQYTHSDSHVLFHRFMEISAYGRQWRDPAWRTSRIKCRVLMALSPLLPAYYSARAWVCRRQERMEQSGLFENAASDWRRNLRRYLEARRNRRRNRARIDQYLLGLQIRFRALTEGR